MSSLGESQVAVVGCGPAGIAAAIQLTRSGIECLVFEKKHIGGLLRNANLVENYPGFPDAVSGVELAGLMDRHLTVLGVQVMPVEVTGLSVWEGSIDISTTQGEFRVAVAIVATGTRPLVPDGVAISSEAAPKVLHEIVPIMGIVDQQVVIVGSGDAAFDYALNLGRCNKVTIINRSDRTRCLPLLRERAESVASITCLENTIPKEVGAGPEGQVSVACLSGGRPLTLSADYVVFAIGREPELGLLSGLPLAEVERLKEDGLLHLVGDVNRGNRRQTAIAVGDGVRVAMEVCERFRERGK